MRQYLPFYNPANHFVCFNPPIGSHAFYKEHIKNSYGINIDINDFFPSFKVEFIIYSLSRQKRNQVISFCERYRLIANLHEYRLPTLKEWVVLICSKIRGWLSSSK